MEGFARRALADNRRFTLATPAMRAEAIEYWERAIAREDADMTRSKISTTSENHGATEKRVTLTFDQPEGRLLVALTVGTNGALSLDVTSGWGERVTLWDGQIVAKRGAKHDEVKVRRVSGFAFGPDTAAAADPDDAAQRLRFLAAGLEDAAARLDAEAARRLAAERGAGENAVYQNYDPDGTAERDLAERHGQVATILRALGDEERDPQMGSMYRVRFADGHEADVFGDELFR